MPCFLNIQSIFIGKTDNVVIPVSDSVPNRKNNNNNQITGNLGRFVPFVHLLLRESKIKSHWTHGVNREIPRTSFNSIYFILYFSYV